MKRLIFILLIILWCVPVYASSGISILSDSYFAGNGGWASQFYNNPLLGLTRSAANLPFYNGSIWIGMGMNGGQINHYYIHSAAGGECADDSFIGIASGFLVNTSKYVMLTTGINDLNANSNCWNDSVANIVTDYKNFIDDLHDGTIMSLPYNHIIVYFSHVLDISHYGPVGSSDIGDLTNSTLHTFHDTLLPELQSRGVIVIDMWQYSVDYDATHGTNAFADAYINGDDVHPTLNSSGYYTIMRTLLNKSLYPAK